MALFQRIYAILCPEKCLKFLQFSYPENEEFFTVARREYCRSVCHKLAKHQFT